MPPKDNQLPASAAGMPSNIPSNYRGNAGTHSGGGVSARGVSALDAVSAMDKQKGIKYGDAWWHTTDANIEAKIKQLQKYFPDTGMSPKAIKTMLANYAKSSPQDWLTIQNLAQDIENYISTQVGKSPTKGFKLWNTDIAKLVNNIKHFKQTGVFGIGGIGDSPVETQAVNKYSYIINTLYPKVAILEPAGVVEALHKVKEAYDYDLQVFSNMSRGQDKNADTRLTKYEEIWNNLWNKIESEYYSDYSKLYEFLKAYQKKPIEPLSGDTATDLNNYIAKLGYIVKTPAVQRS